MSSKQKIIFILLLFIAGVSLYWQSIFIPYYGDDCKYVLNPPPANLFYFFFHPNPNPDWYRPLEMLFHILFQNIAGINTIPLHSVQLLLHLFLAWGVFYVALKLLFSFVHASISSFFMLVAQTNVFAVASNDTLSQVMGTLCGCASLWCLYAMNNHNENKKRKVILLYVFSISLFTLALFSK